MDVLLNSNADISNVQFQLNFFLGLKLLTNYKKVYY